MAAKPRNAAGRQSRVKHQTQTNIFGGQETLELRLEGLDLKFLVFLTLLMKSTLN